MLAMRCRVFYKEVEQTKLHELLVEQKGAKNTGGKRRRRMSRLLFIRLQFDLIVGTGVVIQEFQQLLLKFLLA